MKKEKRNKKTKIFAIVMLVLGIGLIILKGFMPEYLDADGVLHEDFFFLLPVGFFCIFCSLISWAVLAVRGLLRK